MVCKGYQLRRVVRWGERQYDSGLQEKFNSVQFNGSAVWSVLPAAPFQLEYISRNNGVVL